MMPQHASTQASPTDTYLGTHTLLNLYQCASGRIDCAQAILEALNHAAKLAGATVLSTQHHEFSPQGVTAIALLAESHLSIHTWPEKSQIAIDLFSCSDIDPAPAVDYLIDFFEAQSHHCQTLARD